MKSAPSSVKANRSRRSKNLLHVTLSRATPMSRIMTFRAVSLTLAAFGIAACSGSAPPSQTSQTKPPLPSVALAAAPSAVVPIQAPNTPSPPQSLVTNASPIFESEWDGHWQERAKDEKNLCAVANTNIQRAIDEVLRQPALSEKPFPRQTSSSKTPRMYQKLVEGRYALTQAERRMLDQNGFVVLDRLSRRSYAHAYHDIYQSQLPVYVTMDSLFHALFKAHETLMVHVEYDLLRPRLESILTDLRSSLWKTGASWPEEIRHDVDLYLTMAASLLVNKPVAGVLQNLDAETKAILTRIEQADSLAPIELFGRTRMMDFSQYRPRGHYAVYEQLEPYFKAVMWMSRLELNLVSRSSRSSAPGAAPDPRETPREAMMAIALARLVGEANAEQKLVEIEDTLRALGGKREDVGIADLQGLDLRTGKGKLDDPKTFEALKKEIGSGFVRTARLHYMPEGSRDLPVIFTLLGPRVTPDTAAQRLLVHGETPQRYDLHATDMAFVLGHDRAREYLRSDLNRFPLLEGQLTRARRQMSDIHGDDLYSSWLEAIRVLSKDPPARAPSFMHTKPFRDLRLNSAIAAYGQLRRNNVLLAGQGYDEGGCEIPDGYVEPAPEVLDRLIVMSERASALLVKLGEPRVPEGTAGANLPALFSRMTRLFKAFRRIVEREITGEPLTEVERRLLATVAEIIPATSSTPPLYTGWYFQLFRSRYGALDDPSFIADYHTSTNSGQVAYAGAKIPSLGIFVVDVGGAPRLMVGPVATAYELHAPLSQRLTDEEGKLQANTAAPWAAHYSIAGATPPTLRFFEDEERYSEFQRVYRIRSKEKLGTLKIEMLSHHGQPCGEGQTKLNGTRGEIRVKLLKMPDDDSCTGGYRITVNGNVFPVDSSYWPYDIGLGDMWSLNEDDENQDE